MRSIEMVNYCGRAALNPSRSAAILDERGRLFQSQTERGKMDSRCGLPQAPFWDLMGRNSWRLPAQVYVLAEGGRGMGQQPQELDGSCMQGCIMQP